MTLLMASKQAVILLVGASLGYIGFRLVTGRLADWPFTIAALSLPVSAALILLTARSTRGSEILDSNFLAFESGCWALVASFVLVWSVAWLQLRDRRREPPPSWKRVLAICGGFASALVMLVLLPLQGKPDW